MPVSAPGSAGMRPAFVNLMEPGDKVIVCVNGVFGARMKENVERLGGVAVVVEDAWGDPVDPNKVADAFKKNPDAKILAFVHAETSTGALSDAKSLVALAHQHNALAIVDAITRSAACHSRLMSGTSTPSTPVRKSACPARQGYRRSASVSARWRRSRHARPGGELVSRPQRW